MKRTILILKEGQTIEDAIKEHKLDRRRKYYDYGGQITTTVWHTAECTGCTEYEMGYKVSGPCGCSECGYQGKVRNCYPVPVMYDHEAKKVKYN
jgi:hypothetical protein